MKMKILKFIIYAITVVYLTVGALTACSQETFPCSTYRGHHSNLHARYR